VVKSVPEYLKVLEEIERYGLPGLAEVLRQEGIEAVRYVLWDLTGWDIDYAHALTGKGGATEEQKKRGWEMFVCMEKILVSVLHKVLKEQAEETIEVICEGPENLYG
jgi:hypothetical protein